LRDFFDTILSSYPQQPKIDGTVLMSQPFCIGVSCSDYITLNNKINDQVKKDEMGWACSTIWETRNAYRILVGKPEGKRPLGRPRRRWMDNIKGMVWIGLIWLRIGTSGGVF
jgi:hypothetical protein